MDINSLKSELRGRYGAIRKSVSAEDAEAFSAIIAERIFSVPRILKAETVMAYWKLGSETDTSKLIGLITGAGRGVALPYCRGENMGIGLIRSAETDLARGAFGVMEPADALKGNIDVNSIDAVICPGLAFDEEGGRLGRGGGYYDRFLRTVKGRALIIGCAFDCQISETPLPKDEHDVDMDAVVTEKRIIGQC